MTMAHDDSGKALTSPSVAQGRSLEVLVAIVLGGDPLGTRNTLLFLEMVANL